MATIVTGSSTDLEYPPELTLLAIGLGAIVLGVAAWALVRAILKAAAFEPAAMVTVALSLLTLVALVGFLVNESEVLGTIVATGVGALAGSVTALFESRSSRDSSEPTTRADRIRRKLRGDPADPPDEPTPLPPRDTP